MGGFARTGLNPFDREVMWHRFTLNAGKFLSTSRADEMRAAASSVISQEHENTKKRQRPSRQIQTGTVTTPIDAVSCPVALLKVSAEREAAARAREAAEHAIKLTKTCEGSRVPENPPWKSRLALLRVQARSSVPLSSRQRGSHAPVGDLRVPIDAPGVQEAAHTCTLRHSAWRSTSSAPAPPPPPKLLVLQSTLPSIQYFLNQFDLYTLTTP